MCFSAEASFAGGGILTAIGVFTAAKTRKSSLLVFASIPLLFGSQQIAEGFVWLALQNQQFLEFKSLFIYYFMVMADVIWPTIIPLSIFLMVTDKKKKKFLKYILGAGILLSLYYLVCILNFSVDASISGFHIQYITGFPRPLGYYVFPVYVIVTLTPFFLSEFKKIKILGIIMTISCVITGIFYTHYLVSVWCFFAAILSTMILWIVIDLRKQAKKVVDSRDFKEL